METTCNSVTELLLRSVAPETLESMICELDMFTLHAVDDLELRDLANALLDELTFRKS